MRRQIFSTANLLIIAAAMILSISFSSSAQDITGSINGTVRDSAGAAIAGATVTITDPGKDNLVVRTVTTNDNGEFSAPNLRVSVYDIAVEAPNFKKSVSTGIKLDVGQRRSVDVSLEAGNVSEVVTVEAPPVAVELTTPTASTLISGDQVRELSVNNRNFVQLVTLAPGVSANLADQVYVGTTNPEGQANTVPISVNGARSSANTFTVDGADITDRGSNLTIQAYPSIDSIGEFKVLRSLYPAESGKSGGGQINVVTRSGTDQFHGSLFEFVRNEQFNASSFFNNRNAPLGRDENGKAIRPPFRYNNYGFTVGGPIYFMRWGERDPNDSFFAKVPKTYFFFSEEQRKDRRYTTLSSQVPDANLRRGIFSVPICLSGTISATSVRSCPANQILPAGMPISSMAAVSPAAQAYVNNIWNRSPLPNVAPFGLTFPGSAKADFRQEIVKIDTSFTKNWTAYYRYQRDTIPTIDVNTLFGSGSGIPGVSTSNTDSPGRTHTFQTTYVINPKLIVEGRYVYSYGAILSHTTGLLARDQSPINIPLPYSADDDRVPQVAITNLSTLQSFGPYNNFSDKHEWSGNLTWIFGSHTAKFGASFSKYRKNEDNGLGGTNQGSFTGFLNTTAASPTQGLICVDTTNAAIACPAGRQTTEQTFANFLLGFNSTFTQTKYRLTADFRQRNFEAYAQDEYRFRKNITLYYGVRYSFFGSPWAANGLLTNFVPQLFNPAQAPQVSGNGNRIAGTGNFCDGIIVNAQNFQTGPAAYNCTPTASPYGKYVVKAPKLNFAPRVGLAWDPFGKGKTSIRTGYGIYHEQTLVGTFETHLGSNPPYQETITVNQARLDQPVPTGSTPAVVASNAVPALIRGVDTDYKTPYYQHWSLDWQQQWFKNTLTTVGYYGSKGTHLIGVVDINLLPPGYALSLGNVCSASNSGVAGGTAACQARDAGGNPIPFTTSPSTILDQLRPYRGWRGISMIQPRFNSNYHSLQVSATQRFSGNSIVQLAYTWSKNLTDNQTDRSTAPQNPYDIQAEYGRAQLDRRHILTVNYVYEIPFYSNQKGFVGKVLGGWEVSGIGTYQTGLPFTVTYSAYDPAGIGFLNASSPAGGRPYVFGDPNSNAPHTVDQYFNIAAFQRTSPTGAPALPGDAGRGVIQGPPTFRIDFTLSKNIRFNENLRLQLRGEAFNVLNHTNFNTLGLTASTPSTFGTVTGTRDPRILQFGIKFYF